jgi:hypothetical protein
MSEAYIVSVRKSEGKRPLVRIGFKLEDNIKVSGKEVGYEVMGSIRVSQDRIQ